MYIKYIVRAKLDLLTSPQRKFYLINIEFLINTVKVLLICQLFSNTIII